MSIGKRLSQLLQEKHIKQRELANAVGITETSISRYVSGDREPKGKILKKIADYLEVSVDYFFTEDQKPEERLISEIAERLIILQPYIKKVGLINFNRQIDEEITKQINATKGKNGEWFL